MVSPNEIFFLSLAKYILTLCSVHLVFAYFKSDQIRLEKISSNQIRSEKNKFKSDKSIQFKSCLYVKTHLLLLILLFTSQARIWPRANGAEAQGPLPKKS